MNEAVTLSLKSKAILFEICEALQRFYDTGEKWSIFINKMSLSLEERQNIREFLGQGSIKIELSASSEAAEWLESGIAGIWYGVFYDQIKNPIIETIEICTFPEVASAQREDVNQGLNTLKLRLLKNTE